MNKPIGCRVFHYTRKDGEFDRCMYCNQLFFNGVLIHQGNVDLNLNFTKIKHGNYNFTLRRNKLFEE